MTFMNDMKAVWCVGFVSAANIRYAQCRYDLRNCVHHQRRQYEAEVMSRDLSEGNIILFVCYRKEVLVYNPQLSLQDDVKMLFCMVNLYCDSRNGICLLKVYCTVFFHFSLLTSSVCHCFVFSHGRLI
jgi:hypothetical protein